MSYSFTNLPVGIIKSNKQSRGLSDYDEDVPLINRKRVSRSSSDATLNIPSRHTIVDLTSDSDHDAPAKKRRLGSQSSRAAGSSSSSSNVGDKGSKHTEEGEVFRGNRKGDYRDYCSDEYSENEPEGPDTNRPSFIVAIPPGPKSATQRERLEAEKSLKCLAGPPVTIVNNIDDTSPPKQFVFVEDSVLGKGVEKLSDEFMIGCDCRAENGRHCGCEYRERCGCVQESARDDNGDVHFPYSAGNRNFGALRQIYLDSRWHIFECNQNCNCKSNCKNKVVQNGRQIPLEIFKTVNRGWGLRCPLDIKKGKYIDTYRGEIITNDEAEERGEERSQDPNNYLMDLDKFCEKYISPEELTEIISPEEFDQIQRQVDDGEYETKMDKGGKVLWLNPKRNDHYVCDSRETGGPTKFMNHSCDPNCRIFTVSYNHADRKLYDVAFFALTDIPAYTELTFNYKDEDDKDVITDERAQELKKELGFMPIVCLCGSSNCRRYFFN